MANPGSSQEHALGYHKLCGRYQLQELLLKTSESQLWGVVDEEGRKYAARIIELKNGNSSRFYQNELDVFSSLTNGNIILNRRFRMPTVQGFPDVYFIGRHRNQYDVIVMEFLSLDLDSLRFDTRCNTNIGGRGYQMLASSMLSAVMALHRYGFVHQNLAPFNFRITDGSIPYLLNFTLAKRYIHPTTNLHDPPGREQVLVGTLKYSSLSTQLGRIQSRKDDLISLGYCIIDIMKGYLPWDLGIPVSCSGYEMAECILSRKANTSLRDLCLGLPRAILLYMEAVHELHYHTTPDYTLLRALLESNE